jgi:predicted MPP superfamily phosphohydrolase
MAEGPEPSRRYALKAVTAVVVGTVTGLGADTVIHERSALEVTRQTVHLRAWPAALDQFTIGFLSDLHRGATVSRALIEQAVDAVLAQRPDLIVLGGDYVTWGDRDYVESAAESVSRLRAPCGVMAVLGNHDDDRVVAAALRRAGVEVLRDDRVRLTIAGQSLDLVGVRFWTRRLEDIAPLVDRAQAVRILLAHDPRRLKEASELGFPLVLSGHTHGGQVVLPGLGAIAARKFPVASGLASRAGTTLFVSRGVGTVYLPVRYRCPPEVVALTLRSADSAAPAGPPG